LSISVAREVGNFENLKLTPMNISNTFSSPIVRESKEMVMETGIWNLNFSNMEIFKNQNFHNKSNKIQKNLCGINKT
jgi:hypothetical protein